MHSVWGTNGVSQSGHQDTSRQLAVGFWREAGAGGQVWTHTPPTKVTVADISQGGWSSAGNPVGLLWNKRACQNLRDGAKEEAPRSS